MNKQVLLIGLITTAVSFAYYLYHSNRSIEKDIAQAHSFCSEKMVDFHKREQNKHQHIAIKTKNNINKTNPRVALKVNRRGSTLSNWYLTSIAYKL